MLRACAAADIDRLPYFGVTSAAIRAVPVDISRTGYTGDLGYEVWVDAAAAVEVWDAIVAAGQAVDIKPAGMLALDVARLEAGLVLADVDYVGSRKASTEAQKYTPFEMGLGRLVDVQKSSFIGKSPLVEERARGPRRKIVGLEVNWTDVEAVYERYELPPVAPAAASRSAVPVMSGGRQVGRGATAAWAPTRKRQVARATNDAPPVGIGTQVRIEITVEGTRHFVGATVVPTPFFNPPRKTATPPRT